MLKEIFFIVVIVATACFFAGCDSGGSSGESYPFYLTEVSTIGSIGGLSVDYIELYNSTDEDIDLTGYYFGDRADDDHLHAIGSTVSLNEWDADTEYVSDETTTYGDGVEGSWVAESTESVGDTAVIPAGGYLIILFSNDFAEVDDASNTLLPSSWKEFDEDNNGDEDGGTTVTLNATYTVDGDFVDSKYLTIPEGLSSGSNKDGVYIYKSDGTQATTFFTYEEDEQEDDKVFLYDGSSWSQGDPSPGTANN